MCESERPRAACKERAPQRQCRVYLNELQQALVDGSFLTTQCAVLVPTCCGSCELTHGSSACLGAPQALLVQEAFANGGLSELGSVGSGVEERQPEWPTRHDGQGLGYYWILVLALCTQV